MRTLFKYIVVVAALAAAPAAAQVSAPLICTDGLQTLKTCRTLEITGCPLTITNYTATYACAGGGGGVTSVTGSNGINSSGGATPNITPTYGTGPSTIEQGNDVRNPPTPAHPGAFVVESALGAYVEGPVCGVNTVPLGAGAAAYTCGSVPAAAGGTGADSSATTGVPYVQLGTWSFDQQLYKLVGGGNDGQIPIGGTEGGNAWTLSTITAGTDIDVSNGKGSITIGLHNNSTTVNGQVCTLGAPCTIGAAPSGSAGGDLAGTYPNPTVFKETLTGASTASGVASWDYSASSGNWTSSTGTQTYVGPQVSNIGGTTQVPRTTVGVAGQNGDVYTGTAPASVAGPGTSCGSMQSYTGATGGATTGNGTTGGTGEGELHRLGAGGSAAGGTNATGGPAGTYLIGVDAGGARSGAGTKGANGTLTVKAFDTGHGQCIQAKDHTDASNFTVDCDVGSITTNASATLTVGLAMLYGAVTSRLNAINLAITGQAIGDLLVADTTTTFARLVDIATGNVLLSGGVGAQPTYGKVGLTTHVSGTLGVGNGGTGIASAGGVSNRALFTPDGNTFTTGLLPAAAMTVMVGANGLADGVQGAVPAPLIANRAQFLRGDGAWTTPASGSSEFNFSAYSVSHAAGTGQISQTVVTNASTINLSTSTVDVGGSPAVGSVTYELCSDGNACAGGNIYVTCTFGCNASRGTVTTCTVNKSAVAGSTTLTWNETSTPCATDPGTNLNAHLTTP